MISTQNQHTCGISSQIDHFWSKTILQKKLTGMVPIDLHVKNILWLLNKIVIQDTWIGRIGIIISKYFSPLNSDTRTLKQSTGGVGKNKPHGLAVRGIILQEQVCIQKIFLDFPPLPRGQCKLAKSAKSAKSGLQDLTRKSARNS